MRPDVREVARARPWLVVGAAALVATWLAQVSIPLLERGERSTPTTLVVAALAAAATAFAVDAVGGRRALLAAATCCGAGLLAEVVGTRTGLPFGEYAYTGELRPTVAGVPLAVVLAWAGMGIPAAAVAARLVAAPAARVVVGAVALTGWDLFLDPQMVGEGYWVWPGGGPWRGIPLSNYAGWLLVSSLLVAAVLAIAPRIGTAPLAGAYLMMSVMEALGFAAFFGDPLVALVGGVVCLPLGVLAVVREPAGRAAAPTGPATPVGR